MRLLHVLAASLFFAFASVAGASAADYSVETTTIGEMMDDPAAKAVLEKHMPEALANPQFEQARGLTLKALQGYAPDQYTDELLAAIQADLDAL